MSAEAMGQAYGDGTIKFIVMPMLWIEGACVWCVALCFLTVFIETQTYTCNRHVSAGERGVRGTSACGHAPFLWLCSLHGRW